MRYEGVISESHDGLLHLIAEAGNIAAEAQQTFGELTAQQLEAKSRKLEHRSVH